MNLEHALREVAKVRGKYHIKHLQESKIYSGITNLDQLLGGFDSNKFYTILAQPGNCIYSFVYTIANNIDVLYQANYSIVLQKKDHPKPDDYWQFLFDQEFFYYGKEVFDYANVQRPQLVHPPILLIVDSKNLSDQQIRDIKSKSRSWWQVEVLVIFLHVIDEEAQAPIQASEIPQTVKENSDVIITLYRPEYYGHRFWPDGEATGNQVQVCVLDDKCNELGTTKLKLDLKARTVTSL